VEGRSADDYERELRHKAVTPDYFHAMGIRLLRGRFLNDSDKAPNPPVMLVNEALVRKYFQKEDPIGKRIKFERPQDKGDWVTIAGVVADEKQDGMAAAVRPEVYLPLSENPTDKVTFVIRGNGDSESLIAASRGQVQSVDKGLALTEVTTLRELVRDATGGQRFRTSLLSGFATIALFLAALGIYGVLAYSVSQRAREIGIRMALGAPQAGLFRMVLGQGMRPVVAGSIMGLAGAFAGTNLIKSLLFGIPPGDPPTYLTTTTILAVVALCACAVPAFAAIRVDPLVALREE
jgi:putative ABC transport system permease protein